MGDARGASERARVGELSMAFQVLTEEELTQLLSADGEALVVAAFLALLDRVSLERARELAVEVAHRVARKAE